MPRMGSFEQLLPNTVLARMRASEMIIGASKTTTESRVKQWWHYVPQVSVVENLIYGYGDDLTNHDKYLVGDPVTFVKQKGSKTHMVVDHVCSLPYADGQDIWYNCRRKELSTVEGYYETEFTSEIQSMIERTYLDNPHPENPHNITSHLKGMSFESLLLLYRISTYVVIKYGIIHAYGVEDSEMMHWDMMT